MARARTITEEASIRFTVPLVPPSVNHYVKHTRQGRHYVTPEGKAFKAAVATYAKGQGFHRIRNQQYSLIVVVYFGKGQKGDGDNLWKCIADGLVDAGVIHSDAAVTQWHLHLQRDCDKPRTEIEVVGLV